jgi:hypothetical protein
VPKTDGAGDVSLDDTRSEVDLIDEPVSVVDASHPPLIVGFEPSVVALDVGSEVVLQLVVNNATGSYRVPVGLSYDPRRISIEAFEPAPGVDVMEGSIEVDDGWMTLDLMVAAHQEDSHVVGALTVRALSAGPVPLAFTSAGAVAGDGSLLPVAANDGAIFVSGAEMGGF